MAVSRYRWELYIDVMGMYTYDIDLLVRGILSKWPDGYFRPNVDHQDSIAARYGGSPNIKKGMIT